MLATVLDKSTAIGRVCLDWPGDTGPSADSVPLRLCGGLHALVLSGRDGELARHYPPHIGNPPEAPLVTRVLNQHEGFLLKWMKSPPQTNEVARAAVLWPGLMAVSALVRKPLHLLEVGASAGLNLNLDRFGYRLGPLIEGDENSAVQLAPQWQGKEPLQHPVTIAEKEGCDINPLSAAVPDDALRLRSYCWADQALRAERLNAAIELACQFPVQVEKRDAVDWLSLKLQELRDDLCPVIYSTIAWQYLSEAARTEGERIILSAAARGKPLAWLRFEADGRSPGAGVRLKFWPGDHGDHVDCLLGRADFHGRWVDWRGLG